MIVYVNGDLISVDQASVSPNDRGFVFGDGVYEALRAYNGKLFRAQDHIQRMVHSLSELRINGFDPDGIVHIGQSLIQANHLESGEALFYIQVTRGVAPRLHPFPDPDVPPTVYAFAVPFQPNTEALQNGVEIILHPDIRWARCDIKVIALTPNVLACQAATEKGAHEAVFVRNGALTDGSHTNFCAVFNGQLVTPPCTNYILSGITRKVVLELCQSLRIPYREAPVYEKDLDRAQEFMLLGTGTDVTPVIAIDGKPVNNGKPGPITTQLQRAYFDLLYGI